MDARLRPARAVALAFLGVALIAAGPWVGWWPVLVLAAVSASWRLMDAWTQRSQKPEWPLALGWLVSTGAIAAGVLLTGGANSPAKSWLIVPAITLPARFNRRGLNAGIAVCVLVLLVVTVGVDPHVVAKRPQLVLFPLGLIGAVMALAMAQRSAELQHRSEAVIDQLTGMLNRKALEQRVVELELQSRVTKQPVGLIVCDIDKFKRVNDVHGHAMGDAVLKDVAYRLRKELRAYDLAYRLGGEEFVVLVPGASLAMTHDLAERLRAATESAPIEGIEVTASFGVAVSHAGGLDFDALFREADAALYRAKTKGRNRVSTAGSQSVPALT